jgi:hypothetical protein
MTKQTQQVMTVIAPVEHGRITEAILDFVSQVPASKVAGSDDPGAEARRLANRAAQRAALTAGSLALPPGPLGWLTLLPELIAIWKIQGSDGQRHRHSLWPPRPTGARTDVVVPVPAHRRAGVS